MIKLIKSTWFINNAIDNATSIVLPLKHGHSNPADHCYKTDSKLSQIAPSILAMTSMAVAIDGLSMTEKTCWRLGDIVTQIHESTHKVNEVSSSTLIVWHI